MDYWREEGVDLQPDSKNCCVLKFKFEDDSFRLLEIIDAANS